MSKLDKLKILKLTKSRTRHICSNCNSTIEIGSSYYSEQIKDKFLQSLNIKKFCESCYEKYGNKLLEMGTRKVTKNKRKPYTDNLDLSSKA